MILSRPQNLSRTFYLFSIVKKWFTFPFRILQEFRCHLVFYLTKILEKIWLLLRCFTNSIFALLRSQMASWSLERIPNGKADCIALPIVWLKVPPTNILLFYFEIVETHFSELDIIVLDRIFGPKQEVDTNRN